MSFLREKKRQERQDAILLTKARKSVYEAISAIEGARHNVGEMEDRPGNQTYDAFGRSKEALTSLLGWLEAYRHRKGISP